jgi:hypothetical protein
VREKWKDRFLLTVVLLAMAAIVVIAVVWGR